MAVPGTLLGLKTEQGAEDLIHAVIVHTLVSMHLHEYENAFLQQVENGKPVSQLNSYLDISSLLSLLSSLVSAPLGMGHVPVLPPTGAEVPTKRLHLSKQDYGC